MRGNQACGRGLLAGCVVLIGAGAAWGVPVRAAVVRSTGTMFLNQTIWYELNTGWADFGDVPVEIDYTSLAGYDLTLAQIEATDADVLILSCAGFLSYGISEIDAVIEYVEAGHGLVITYSGFLSEDRALAPLVGLSESIELGTVTVSDPIQFDFLVQDHPVFEGLPEPYVSGVPFRARPPLGEPWLLDGGAVIANLFTDVIPPGPGIIANETDDYRGLYFAHYIENKADGSNEQDMQVFYNGLLWTAGAPEPSTALLILMGGVGMIRRRGLRDHGPGPLISLRWASFGQV